MVETPLDESPHVTIGSKNFQKFNLTPNIN